MPRKPSENAHLAQIVVGRKSSSRLAPFCSQVLRPGHPSESYNWQTEKSALPPSLLIFLCLQVFQNESIAAAV